MTDLFSVEYAICTVYLVGTYRFLCTLTCVNVQSCAIMHGIAQSRPSVEFRVCLDLFFVPGAVRFA